MLSIEGIEQVKLWDFQYHEINELSNNFKISKIINGNSLNLKRKKIQHLHNLIFIIKLINFFRD